MSGRRRRRVSREGKGRFEQRCGSGGQRRELLFIVIDNDVMSKLAGGGVVVAAAAGLLPRDLVNGVRPPEQGFFDGKGLTVEYNLLFVDDLRREVHPREIVL